ncbi:hypothetical protein DFH09DRAFT_805710, partial [Mycena vulgaris]
GRNSKYNIEMLEFFQGLHRDWPPEVREFIRDNCWVINNTGRRTGHMPVDEAQEMNIKDIKVSGEPSRTSQYLSSLGYTSIGSISRKKLHPAIHVIRSVSSHMEMEFKTRVRGWKHTVPKKEVEIQEYQHWWRTAKIPRLTAGRTSKSNSDRPKDVPTKGFVGLQTSETLENWIEGRTIERATHQKW